MTIITQNDSSLGPQNKGKRRYKPTENGSIIQRAREDAGLSREEVARRLVVQAHALGMYYHAWERGSCKGLSRGSSIDVEVKSLTRSERSRIHEPSAYTVGNVLAVIDAGPSGTSDEVVAEAFRRHEEEQIELGKAEAFAEGGRLAVPIIRAADEPELMHANLLTFLNYFDGGEFARNRILTGPSHFHHQRIYTLYGFTKAMADAIARTSEWQ